MTSKGKKVVSRKLFALEVITQNREESKNHKRVRTLVPDDAPKYDPIIHFHSWEESPYLARALNGVPYMTLKTDDPTLMEDIMENGYPDKLGRIWRSFFGYWKDREGHCFMCLEEAEVTDPRSVGIITKLKGSGDFTKAGKYINRLISPLLESEQGGTPVIWGEEIEWVPGENYSLVQVEPHSGLNKDARLISVLYVELGTQSPLQKALEDGDILVNAKGVKALGLARKPRIGMAWRGTFGTQRGLGKGHIVYVPHLEHDVVIFGPKTLVVTEKFFFGSMGRLHVGTPHTDRQAFVNFQFYRKGLADVLATTYMKEVVEMTQDEESIRQLLLQYSGDVTDLSVLQDNWILRKALRYGVSFLRFPALHRRVVKYLMTKVLACDSRARIPMAGKTFGVALYSYVLPDINVFDKDGVVHPEWGIPEGCIVCPDLEPGTVVVCYRQPSGHTNEWVRLTVVAHPMDAFFKGTGICMLGQAAYSVLRRLGGGDMDDQFVIVYDPVWVEAFGTLPVYPEVLPKISDMIDSPDDQFFSDGTPVSEFADNLLERIWQGVDYYTNEHVSWQIQKSARARAGIGPVVNYIMIDELLSDPDTKASMLANMTPGTEAYEWLVDREPYQAARLATNLEQVIDAQVKDDSLFAKLGDVSGELDRFHAGCKVYPESMLGRIPPKKARKRDYVIAKSLFCQRLDTIHAESIEMRNLLTRQEWSLATPATRDLINAGFKDEPELRYKLRGNSLRIVEDGYPRWERQDPDNIALISDIWIPFWNRQFAGGEPDEDAYNQVMAQLRDALTGKDDDYMKRLSVALYYDTYKTRSNTPVMDPRTGRLRGYKDGLLWSPLFSGYFIDVLREKAIAGYYTPVRLSPKWAGKLSGVSVEVAIKHYQVFIKNAETGEFDQRVGEVAALELHSDAIGLIMSGGLVEYRKSQPMLQPKTGGGIKM